MEGKAYGLKVSYKKREEREDKRVISCEYAAILAVSYGMLEHKITTYYHPTKEKALEEGYQQLCLILHAAGESSQILVADGRLFRASYTPAFDGGKLLKRWTIHALYKTRSGWVGESYMGRYETPWGGFDTEFIRGCIAKIPEHELPKNMLIEATERKPAPLSLLEA